MVKRSLAGMFAAASMVSSGAQAAPLNFSYNGGPIFDAAIFDPFAPLIIQDFFPFEDIIVSVTIDSDADLLIVDDNHIYTDESGMIILTGAESGTTVALAPGVELELEGANEFDIESPFPIGEVIAGSFFLFDDADYRTNVDFLSDPADLTSVIDDINFHFASGIGATQNFSLGSSAVVVYADSFFGTEFGEPIPDEDLDFFFAFEYGPVASVPLPLTGPLLLAGLGGLALWRRKAA